MNIFWSRVLIPVFVLFVAAPGSPAQSSTSAQIQESVVLTKLFPPIYPPLARQTRIAGDVVIEIQIRKDGSVESTKVVSGHPLLKPAALDSAQHSQFECRDCTEGVHPYQIVYLFQLGPTRYCAQASETSRSDEKGDYSPRVLESKDHVTVIDYPVGTCDMARTATKVHSLKCLYLWRCSTR